jgi:adenylate cyclase, class 2
MSYLNVEIKAQCQNPEYIRDYLKKQGAEFRGTDEQTDTYFQVNYGRLKLREGNIENNLIWYLRENQPGPKSSQFHLVKSENPLALKEALEKSCGIKMIVRKKREIYYIRNVKFHLDIVPGLGSFMEIEAGNISEEKTKEELLAQCKFYLAEMGIQDSDLIAGSYSDMMMQKEVNG